MIKKKLLIPIYEQYLFIIIAEDFKPLEEPYSLKPTDGYLGLTFDHKKDIYVAIKPDSHPSTIAHESVHVANYLYDIVGAEVDIRNDEPYAYLIGWIVEQIYIIKDGYINTRLYKNEKFSEVK